LYSCQELRERGKVHFFQGAARKGLVLRDQAGLGIQLQFDEDAPGLDPGGFSGGMIGLAKPFCRYRCDTEFSGNQAVSINPPGKDHPAQDAAGTSIVTSANLRVHSIRSPLMIAEYVRKHVA
jgi:hypothetical protein